MTTKGRGKASIRSFWLALRLTRITVTSMKTLILSIGIALFLGSASFAQPRPVEMAKPANVPAAPPSFEAKYEGGMFGFSKKEVGTLKFDDENGRLVFFGQDQKEKFQIPYRSVNIIYPQSKSVTSTTGNVVKMVPLPGASLAGFLKEKRQYLIVHFDDPDIDAAEGVVGFKIDSKELLDSVLVGLAGKAKLTQRGEAYYRKRPKG